jgi:hypothetical protein
MKKVKGEMRKEYDFTGGVRGRYAARFAQGVNLVLLDPDVAAIFKDSKSVNAALRKVGGIVRKKPATSVLAVREKKPKYGK